MWRLKNNDEYCVFASTRRQAILKFKEDLGIDVKGYMLIKIFSF